MAICSAMAGAIMFGLDQGNFGNVQSFDSFRREWCVGKFGDELTCGPDPDHGADKNVRWTQVFVLWGASLITIAAAVGGLVLGPLLTNALGRRPCISVGASICFVGCLLVSYLSFGLVFLFMVGRFLTGFGVGVCCFALPMYNSEIATPGIRGATGGLFQFNVVLGGFVATLVTLGCKDWRVGMMLPGIAGAIVAVMIWFTPESPRYVMEKKGYEAGVAALAQVRSADVTQEAREINSQLTAEREAGQCTYRELFGDANLRKRTFIACYLQVAQQLTGVNAFLGYASTLFAGAGFKDPYMVNVVWNFVFILGCAAGLAAIDSPRGGRRIQLMGATIFMGPALVVAGLALLLKWSGYITLVMVCVYGFFFQFAWGTIPWIYPSEIFTMAEKDRALGLAVFVQYAINGVVYIITPYLINWSVPGTLIIFGMFNIFNFIFVAKWIKETKCIPLEAIPALFGGMRRSASVLTCRDLAAHMSLESLDGPKPPGA